MKSRLKVMAFAVSVDGFGAGPHQTLQDPLGQGGLALHEWFFHTRCFAQMHAGEGGDDDIDNAWAQRSFQNIGAWIMGRHMFGPVRGPWPDDSWRGWWGEEPPYHVPVFVLTHHPRQPLPMKGGTVFHFITGGILEALKRAREAAQGKDVRIGGGVATVRQYLQAGLVDEMHLVQSPALLGRGEALLAGIDLLAMGFQRIENQTSTYAQHVLLKKGRG